MSASPPDTDSPKSQKRTFHDIDGPSPSKSQALTWNTTTSPSDLLTPPTARASLPASTTSSRLSSPAPSVGSASVSDTPPADQPSQNEQATAPSNTIPPAKKRKLTLAEKEAKRLEKEARDKQKAEERVRKEEEKRTKDEERRKKKEVEEEEKRKRELERTEKKKLRDAELQKREEEKRKKEDERAKKEKSQLRLNSFFKKPDPTPASPASAGNSRRNSIDMNHTHDSTAPGSKDASPSKPKESDYDKTFPEFFLQSHTFLAPINRFSKDSEATRIACEKIDVSLSSTGSPVPKPTSMWNAVSMFNITPHKRAVDKGVLVTVKDLVMQENGSLKASIDLTGSSKRQTLANIPMKLLQFREDVRPPYHGTFTRPLSSRLARSLSRNPFKRTLPETDYEYDSEAEWEEPEEGEDLNSEMEEEVSEDGDEDMEGFLDDEEDEIRGKRRILVGDLEPCSSGLCWESESHKWKSESDFDLEAFRMEIIHESANGSINPYSTQYWPTPHTMKSGGKPLPSGSSTPMNPPRVPLHALNKTNAVINNGTATYPLLISESEASTKFDNTSGLHTATQSLDPQATAMKPKRIVTDDLLPAFKLAVEGSNLTKAGLIEVLKKQFPKVSKDTIKDTLGVVAVRQGRREADKTWILLPSDSS